MPFRHRPGARRRYPRERAPSTGPDASAAAAAGGGATFGSGGTGAIEDPLRDPNGPAELGGPLRDMRKRLNAAHRGADPHR